MSQLINQTKVNTPINDMTDDQLSAHISSLEAQLKAAKIEQQKRFIAAHPVAPHPIASVSSAYGGKGLRDYTPNGYRPVPKGQHI